MTEETDEKITGMTASELTALAKEIRSEQARLKKIAKRKVPGVRLHGYLGGEMEDKFNRCMDFAWKSGWLKRKNEYHFVSWAIERIMDSIEEEMSHNPRFSDLNDSQT